MDTFKDKELNVERVDRDMPLNVETHGRQGRENHQESQNQGVIMDERYPHHP